MLHKPLRTPLPRQMKIFHQEARNDHPNPVVHPPCRSELAHSCVNDGEPCHALCPQFETSSCGGVGIDGNAVEFRVEVCPRGVWATEKNIGVEVAPREFAFKCRVMFVGRVKFLQQSSWVNHPKSKCGRHTTRPFDGRQISDIAVVVQTIASECLPSMGHSLRGKVGQFVVDEIVNMLIEQMSGVVDRNPVRVRGRITEHRVRSIESESPSLPERSEDRIWRTVIFQHPSRRNEIRGACSDETTANLTQGSCNLGIAAVPVWAVIARHVHFGDPESLHHVGKHLGRTTVANDERSFGGLPEVVKSRGQCSSTWATRPIKCRIDNKQGHYRTSRQRPLKGLMVANAQVSPEPQDDRGSGHTDSVDVSAGSRMVEREIKPSLSHSTQPRTITAP